MMGLNPYASLELNSCGEVSKHGQDLEIEETERSCNPKVSSENLCTLYVDKFDSEEVLFVVKGHFTESEVFNVAAIYKNKLLLYEIGKDSKFYFVSQLSSPKPIISAYVLPKISNSLFDGIFLLYDSTAVIYYYDVSSQTFEALHTHSESVGSVAVAENLYYSTVLLSNGTDKFNLLYYCTHTDNTKMPTRCSCCRQSSYGNASKECSRLNALLGVSDLPCSLLPGLRRNSVSGSSLRFIGSISLPSARVIKVHLLKQTNQVAWIEEKDAQFFAIDRAPEATPPQLKIATLNSSTPDLLHIQSLDLPPNPLEFKQCELCGIITKTSVTRRQKVFIVLYHGGIALADFETSEVAFFPISCTLENGVGGEIRHHMLNPILAFIRKDRFVLSTGHPGCLVVGSLGLKENGVITINEEFKLMKSIFFEGYINCMCVVAGKREGGLDEILLITGGNIDGLKLLKVHESERNTQITKERRSCHEKENFFARLSESLSGDMEVKTKICEADHESIKPNPEGNIDIIENGECYLNTSDHIENLMVPVDLAQVGDTVICCDGRKCEIDNLFLDGLQDYFEHELPCTYSYFVYVHEKNMLYASSRLGLGQTDLFKVDNISSGTNKVLFVSMDAPKVIDVNSTSLAILVLDDFLGQVTPSHINYRYGDVERSICLFVQNHGRITHRAVRAEFLRDSTIKLLILFDDGQIEFWCGADDLQKCVIPSEVSSNVSNFSICQETGCAVILEGVSAKKIFLYSLESNVVLCNLSEILNVPRSFSTSKQVSINNSEIVKNNNVLVSLHACVLYDRLFLIAFFEDQPLVIYRSQNSAKFPHNLVFNKYRLHSPMVQTYKRQDFIYSGDKIIKFRISDEIEGCWITPPTFNAQQNVKPIWMFFDSHHHFALHSHYKSTTSAPIQFSPTRYLCGGNNSIRLGNLEGLEFRGESPYQRTICSGLEMKPDRIKTFKFGDEYFVAMACYEDLPGYIQQEALIKEFLNQQKMHVKQDSNALSDHGGIRTSPYLCASFYDTPSPTSTTITSLLNHDKNLIDSPNPASVFTHVSSFKPQGFYKLKKINSDSHPSQPITKIYTVFLFSSLDLRSPIGQYKCKESEEVLSLSFSEAENETMLLIGCGSGGSEMIESRGRIIGILVANREAIITPQEKVYCSSFSIDSAGPVTILDSLTHKNNNHILLHSMGSRVFAHELDKNYHLPGGAFFETGSYATSHAYIEAYHIFGDGNFGIHLVRWSHDPTNGAKTLDFIAKTESDSTILACGFLVLDSALVIVGADSKGNLKTHFYDRQKNACGLHQIKPSSTLSTRSTVRLCDLTTRLKTFKCSTPLDLVSIDNDNCFSLCNMEEDIMRVARGLMGLTSSGSIYTLTPLYDSVGASLKAKILPNSIWMFEHGAKTGWTDTVCPPDNFVHFRSLFQ